EQAQPQGIRAAADAEGVAGAAELSKLALETLDIGTAGESAGLGHLAKGFHQLGHERLVLNPQIEKWNLLLHAPRLRRWRPAAAPAQGCRRLPRHQEHPW